MEYEQYERYDLDLNGGFEVDPGTGRQILRRGKNPAWGFSSILAVISAVLLSLVLILGNEIYSLGRAESSLINKTALGNYSNTLWIAGIGLGIVLVSALIVSVWKCGEKYEDGSVRMTRFDRIFADVLAAAGCVLVAVFVPAVILLQSWMMRVVVEGKILPEIAKVEGARTLSGLLELSNSYYGYISVHMSTHWVMLFLGVLLAAAGFSAELLILQALAKQVKNRIVFKNTLIWFVISHVYRGISGFVKKTDMNTKWVVLALIIGALVSATWVGLIAVVALIIWKVPGFMKKYEEVKKGIHELKEGNAEYRIPLEGDGEMERLAAEVNEIAGSRQLAVEKELKSQRMKTDLISNVSHDLKTPLTSMVTYVDLLKKEGLDSENAPEYLRILSEKTDRLQKLSVDLFEAAKASSGDIPVELTRVDAAEIVNQALAELDENLRASRIQAILTKRTEDTAVMADGRLLWRVLENVLTNVAKYAQPDSRAYVDLSEDRDRVVIEVKNVSRDPLNIDPDELMERFKRGYDSRTTEGSGLGLAIANDLTRLMGGRFQIRIDGDLFKAVIELEKA